MLETIRARRVTREFTDESVPDALIRQILEAARLAPSGGLRRLNVYVVVRNHRNLRKVRAAAPGILGYPQVVLVICIDHARLQSFAFDDTGQGSIYVDLGTAAENMLLAAAELGLGACPVMSFHKAAVQTILNLPASLEPAMMIVLGYPAPPREMAQRPPIRLPALDEIVHWEGYKGKQHDTAQS